MENSKNLPIYESLATISQAADQITANIETLKADGLLLPDLAEIWILFVKQVRAEVSHAAVLGISDREQKNAVTSQNQRIEIENRIKSS